MNQTIVSKMTAASEESTIPIVKQGLMALSEKTDALFGLLVDPSKLPFPAESKQAFIKSISTAWAESFSTVFLSGLIFIVIGILTALAMGKSRIKRDKELKEKLDIVEKEEIA